MFVKCLQIIDFANKKVNIGYWIGIQYQGKGITTESIKLVVNYVFDELKLEEFRLMFFQITFYL